MSLQKSNSLNEIEICCGDVDHQNLYQNILKHIKRYSWGLISSYHCGNARRIESRERNHAILEESSHHGRKSANHSVCDSPKDPGVYRRSSQGDCGVSRLERARIAREKFEADRQRRLEQLKEARRQAEMFREQQMLLKKKRIEEARVRDVERRKSVEDRRKKLEEIEKTRRETIQRKIERVERVNDSRRGTLGPTGARIFGFGSCTPREIYTSHSVYTGKHGEKMIAPYPNEKDKLDRTVSTPNIAANNQRHRSRRAESGASSPTRSLERPRQSSATSRPRPSTSLGQPRSDLPPRRAISSLGVSSTPGISSSGLFDRLSQPRRVQTRSEEVSPERKRTFTSPVKSSSSGSGKPTAKKPLKTGDENDAVTPKTSVVTFQIEQEEDPKSDDPASIEVNVEDVEADALNDVDSENTTENNPLAVKIEEEEVSDSLRNDTSAAATSLPTDRSASPPRTLQLTVEPVSTPAVALPARPSIQRPNSVNADVVHPPTSALPPPSPPAMMNKGSAPSTPTGQRASSTREMTEVEYKQRLAEQRRLARERKAAQEAEKARAREEERRAREAELQRLREAAEKQRLEEEEEQRRQEEEQRRKEEEERLIEEERKRQEELKRQEEEREREEIERKEREEMELRQRQLEEERLAQQRAEEEKRLERKKRLESIMSRVKKSTDTSGSRESLTSSHLDLSPASNGSETLEAERPVSPAPQFKSALLQSMLSKGKLSTSIRAVSALRRSQGYNGSSGSLIGDLQNLSRSSENLSSTSNSGPTVPSSSSGEMTTSQIEDQLSPPPVVNPAMWRSHPNGIPGLGGHERDIDQPHDFDSDDVGSSQSLVDSSIQSRLDDLPSTGMSAAAQERRKPRPNSVHFDDAVSTSRSGTVSGDIVDDESASSDGDTQLVTHNTVSGQWLAEESHLPASMASRGMADTMS